jgi:hypothetical protein
MKTIPSLIALIAAVMLPATAQAQTPAPAQNESARNGMKATSVVAEAGFSNDSTHNNGWLGGMALWQPTHRVGIAVSGRWIDAGNAASGFAADVSAELGLLSRSSPSVPYVRVGVGAYRATFDLATTTQTVVRRATCPVLTARG